MGSCVSVHIDNDNKSDSGSSCWQLRGSHESKRMKGSSFSSQQIINLQHHLPSLPNRIFNNGKSRTSCIFSQQGKKGINQDAMVVWEDFACDDAIFCGVFDGHGPHGHLVARKVRDVLPLKLLSSLQFHELRNRDSGNCFKSKESIRMGDSLAFGEENQYENPLMPLWRNVFLDSFKAMDKELRSHPSVDCFCSGSTAVTLIKQGLNLFIGNIGDSRAVLGSRGNNDSVVAVQLTVDLKPDLPVEAERIKRCKGRVFALQDEPEVQRVWLPFDDAPGLAMARAFGDFCLKDYGVISIPEFSHRILTEADQFVVMASDGIWDVLSNQEVVEIVLSAPNRSSAARVLVNSAVREWKLKYPTSKIDDCAVVCLYLDGKVDSESEAEEPQSISSATHNSCHSLCQVECEGDDDDEAQIPEPCLQRNFTVRSAEDSDYPNSRTSAVPCEDGEANVVTEDQKWSGLEGVTRVNSLVQLPRFSGELPSA